MSNAGSQQYRMLNVIGWLLSVDDPP